MKFQWPDWVLEDFVSQGYVQCRYCAYHSELIWRGTIKRGDMRIGIMEGHHGECFRSAHSGEWTDLPEKLSHFEEKLKAAIWAAELDRRREMTAVQVRVPDSPKLAGLTSDPHPDTVVPTNTCGPRIPGETS